MATPISPGVYSKIIDLSEYLTSTSGTIAFLPILTEKGEDNKLVKISSYEEYITKFGEPNIKTFGKYYGQGPYVACQHLEVSSDLYVLRALPDDASFSHAFVAFVNDEEEVTNVNAESGTADDTSTEGGTATDTATKSDMVKLGVFYALTNPASTMKLNTYFTAGGSESVAHACTNIYNPNESEDNDECYKSVLMYVRGYGRGDYYNKISFILRADHKPANFGLYNFEVYEDQDGEPVMVESYSVTFDPHSTDTDGESNYIESVVNKYSTRLVIEVNEDAIVVMGKYLQKFYKNDPDISELYPTWNLYDEVVSLKTGKGFPVGVPMFYTSVTAPDESLLFDADGNRTWGGTTVDADGKEVDQEEGRIYIFVGDGTGDSGDGNNYKRCAIADDGTISHNLPNGQLPSVSEPVAGYDLGLKAQAIWEAYCKRAEAQYAMYVANKAYNAAVILTDEKAKDKALTDAIVLVNQAQLLIDTADSEFDAASNMSIMELTDETDDELGAQPYYLKGGSLGSIVYERSGKRIVYPRVADQVLSLAYSGLLKDPVSIKKVDESSGTVIWKTKYAQDVLDTDWIYFTLVYDAGYRADVKESAKQLVENRGDCVLISDCGDNSDINDVELYTGAVKGAPDCRIWNSFYCARYEPYSRIYDQFTGTDQWFSPVYIMAKMIPQNDALYDVWYANAGFNRGVTSEVKELRWSANKGERDRLYLAQVNPIVHFPEGMTVFSQLTTQKKTSTLSDLNCVRTVLYIKRAIEQYCNNYLFEFNDSITHEAIAGGIKPFLDSIVTARGLKSYSIEVGATDYEYKTKTCHVNVTLAPMKVIEKIQLNLYIQ